jgi:predicted O-methyltransferase YrrM
MTTRRRLANALSVFLDLLLLPLSVPCAAVLWGIRRIGLQRLPLCRRMLMKIGLLPIRHHYYEPFVTSADLRFPLNQRRKLPGIDWNVPAQLSYLRELVYADELRSLNDPPAGELDFRLDNPSFGSGDAEFLYQLVRQIKPKRVFEIGSGYSTLLVRSAIRANSTELSNYTCEHMCIEPYEAPWLEKAVTRVHRKRVEDMDVSLFAELSANDLLFIDSSHIIRPQGDVITEYLEILPTLRKGVIVHVHDIFSPRDYLDEWVTKQALLWNEQYLLEALLTNSDQWEVFAALNMLKHEHFAELRKVCPYLTADREPGSFYIRKIR